MAGKPLEAMALIGAGFRSISMASASLGPVKAMLLSLNAGHLQSQLWPWIDDGEPDIRRKLKQYAAMHDVNLPRKDPVIIDTAAGDPHQPSS
jgi:phosphotransferase system enzyme I (PtsP)